MSFEKVVEAKLFEAVLVNASARKAIGPKLSGATLATVTTAGFNPLKGTLLWDQACYTITGVTVAGGATGGSYTITLETDAVMGYTALPIASTTLGPNHTNGMVVIMDNLHKSPGSPMPTHVQITQGSTGLCHFTINAVAKQYRGVLSTAGNRTSERVLQGSLLGDAGPASPTTILTDTTFYLGQSDTDIGLGKMRLWDKAFFWAIGNSAVTGTWDVDIVGKVGVNGDTVSLATTGTTLAGTIGTLWDKKPLINNFYGNMLRPTQIIVTEVSAGTIKGLEVVGIAKGGRGTMAKR